ncbi:dTDP-4-dehydrorhamnose reductase [Capillibacterium thermochitinicola]|uniref:dTDP-4-dehydrorhamnose reductase n=1 Tax=Capillibacterium thermochitinicola TaxID=2699427 RepID=A0A8J6I1R7_9FIRM|nr:dTDP-4-dehydrorhamnose reductase [Capillibacterium thermochitinicola]MBA2134085.1 dTDP-4-dehydrorhamnose reductase [Capillibacterium thermochitinicola]
MKILVTGCQGQLGRELCRQFEVRNRRRQEFHVVATDVDTLDITDAQQVKNVVEREKPDVIINTAAYTKVDACETDEQTAFRVNAHGARNLAVAAYNIGAKILQVSTDYVFDGTGRTPLREYDPVNPLSVYGKSKALGEQLVMTTNPRYFIVRTAWLYGDGANFIRTILKLASEKEELKVVNDQVGTPTSTVDLAKCILALIQTDYYGIYHGTCEGECTWYDFARRILVVKGIKKRVIPISTKELNLPAKRPAYSVLENFMLKLVGLNTFRNWEEAMTEYLTREGHQ